GIVAVDGQLRLVAWNATFIRMFALPPDDLVVGLPLVELLRFQAGRGDWDPEDPEEAVARRLGEAAKPMGEPVEITLQSGRVLELRRSPLRAAASSAPIATSPSASWPSARRPPP